MSKTAALISLLFLSLGVFLNGGWAYGLFESSEARYAEVAREMVATGDYMSPQIDYVYHFTKPPLAYWITAVGYHLLGQNEFGARFFVALAGGFVVFLCALIYRGAQGGNGTLAGIILICTPAFFALAKVVTTDMFLTLIIVSGFYLWARLERGELEVPTFSWVFGLLAGLAFMTKGPVGLLFWGVVLVPYSLWKDRGRSLGPFWSWRFFGIFALVGLPWFIAVGLRHPGLLEYLLLRESAEAAISSKRFHPGPWYYYILVLVCGLFPWWFVFCSRFKRALAPQVRFWLVWATAPVLLWSLFPAKLPTYILPSIPAWALLAAWLFSAGGFGGRALAGLMPAGILAVCGSVLLILIINPKGWPEVGVLTFGLLLSCALAALAGLALGVMGRGRSAFVSSAVSVIFFQLAVPYLCSDLHVILRIKSDLGKTIAVSRSPGEPILEYRATIYCVPFYVRDKVFVYQNGFVRKKYLNDNLPPHVLVGKKSLLAFLSTPRRVWILTDKSEEKGLLSRTDGLKLVMRHGMHSLWVREPTGGAGSGAGSSH